MKRYAIALAALLLSAPAVAEVREESPNGFVIQLGVDVPADVAKTWATLITPRKWWSSEHSYSGDAANFSLDPRAGGCFCEVLPNKTSPKAAPRGSVEHMRVIYIEEPRVLRMSGALGPLQGGAGTGTLTILLRPRENGTRVLWEYAYGGYVRGDVPQLAKAVDGVLAEQLLGLAQALGATLKSGVSTAPDASSPPQASSVSPAKDEDERIDFLQEMREGIRDSRKDSTEPPATLSDDPPEKTVNEQGFVGR